MSSEIYIGGLVNNKFEKYNQQHTKDNIFLVSFQRILVSIITSFIPPFKTRYSILPYDFVGPIFAFLILSVIINYGYYNNATKVFIAPTVFLTIYSLLFPISIFFVSRAGHSCLTFLQIVSMFGYSLYGFIFTILTSLFVYDEESNAFFYLCMAIFGGFSTFRLIVVFLKSIHVPAARLLVCTLVGTVQIVCLLFLHFGYMHRTFVYGKGGHIKNEEFSF